MGTFLDIIVFIFGVIIGSFLNVVILRFRTGRTLGGRSACMTCSKTLTWYELIPLGSFLTQRGRCRGCRTRISWQYPIVEALTGFLFVLLSWKFAYLLPENLGLFLVLFGFYGIIFSILIVLSVYDIKHKILPDSLVFPFAGLAFLGMFFIFGNSIVLHLPSYTQFLAGIVLPAPFLFLWILSKGKWMGLGDVKLMIGIGFLLGLSAGVTAILISFWVGAGVSILMLLLAPYFGKKAIHLKTALPFGPFLAIGTIIVFLCGLDLSLIGSLFN